MTARKPEEVERWWVWSHQRDKEAPAILHGGPGPRKVLMVDARDYDALRARAEAAEADRDRLAAQIARLDWFVDGIATGEHRDDP